MDLHLSAYGGRNDNLFHGAAAESQSFGAQLTIKGSQYQYDALVQRVGCSKSYNTLSCLRGVSTNTLQSHNIMIPTPGGAGSTPVFMYSSVIDGDFTRNFTYNAYAAGEFIKVPVIFGYVHTSIMIYKVHLLTNRTEIAPTKASDQSFNFAEGGLIHQEASTRIQKH